MARVIAFTFVCLFAAVAFAQPSALRIVVIEGEDAVNVIQQKTATRPVVEVRDRNNLPVSGALVTFSIQGGRAATFGGASTLTVATNAAGQAAVTGLTPTAAGAFQIQVSAAFQGQLATATIAQTNVMTAAQAAAAGAGGGAGGGGLSTTTLAITGAAVAGGAVAALQVVKNDDIDGDANAVEIFTGSFSGQTQTVSTSRNTGGSTCVFTRAVSATVQFEIDDSTGDRVEGRMNITGTETNVSNTCGFPAGGGMTVNWFVPVNGTNSSIRGSETSSFSNPLPTGSIRGTNTASFEGARNGDTITGTVRTEIRSTSVIESGEEFDHITNGTFPLTLTKTGTKNAGS